MQAGDGMSPEAQEEEGTLFALLAVLRRYWAFQMAVVVSVTAAVFAYSVLSPKEFDATASVLPPPDPRAGRGLEALIGQMGAISPLGALVQGTATKDVFVGILKSRTMQDDVVKKFDLVSVYDLARSKAPLHSARTRLERMTSIRVSREGVISVTATAYDPQMAAAIANFHIENLDRLNTSVNVTEAGRSRLFLEGRVAEAQKALKEAEDRLRSYQSKSKAVVMEGQTKAAIEGAAKLEGQILAADVQLKTLETYSTARNPDVIKLKEGIEEMRRQLKRMEYGRGEQRAEGRGQRAANTKQQAAGSRQGTEGGGQRAEGSGQTTGGSGQTTGGSGQQAAGSPESRVPSPEPRPEGEGGADFAMPLGMIPETGLELARMIREAKMQETIFTLLTQQLEQAKIAEAQNTPTVRILDRAIPPEVKSRPSILGNTAIAGVLSLFLGVCLAVVIEIVTAGRKRELTASSRQQAAGRDQGAQPRTAGAPLQS
jgi:uncharacterized protein involved in exopolysaccharide biosynthesis